MTFAVMWNWERESSEKNVLWNYSIQTKLIQQFHPEKKVFCREKKILKKNHYPEHDAMLFSEEHPESSSKI